MKFFGPSGDSFELSIQGYQFPDIDHDEWDSNWLMVRVCASAHGWSWTATDPSMLTFELAWLAKWADHAADQPNTAEEVPFMEQNLRFEACGSRDEKIRLIVHFDLELRPKVADRGFKDGEPVRAELEVTRDQLRTWAVELRDQRAKFPPRGGVGNSKDDHWKPGKP
jgi:hypothetical protein